VGLDFLCGVVYFALESFGGGVWVGRRRLVRSFFWYVLGLLYDSGLLIRDLFCCWGPIEGCLPHRWGGFWLCIICLVGGVDCVWVGGL